MIAKGKENLHVITSMFITTYSTIFIRNLKDIFLSHLFGQFHVVFKICSLISQPKKKKKKGVSKIFIFLYSLMEDSTRKVGLLLIFLITTFSFLFFKKDFNYNLGFLPRRNVLLLIGSKKLYIVGHF